MVFHFILSSMMQQNCTCNHCSPAITKSPVLQKKQELPKQLKQPIIEYVYVPSKPKIEYKTIYRQSSQSIRKNKERQDELNRKERQLEEKQEKIYQQKRYLQKEKLIWEEKSIVSSSTSFEMRRKQQAQFICPITTYIMENPVQTPCQHNFQKVQIEKHLQSNNSCPMCREPLELNELRNNRMLIRLIENFRQKEIKTKLKNEKRIK